VLEGTEEDVVGGTVDVVVVGVDVVVAVVVVGGKEEGVFGEGNIFQRWGNLSHGSPTGVHPLLSNSSPKAESRGGFGVGVIGSGSDRACVSKSCVC